MSCLAPIHRKFSQSCDSSTSLKHANPAILAVYVGVAVVPVNLFDPKRWDLRSGAALRASI